MKLMQRLVQQQNSALIIATHDYRLFPLADRIINLKDGKLNET